MLVLCLHIIWDDLLFVVCFPNVIKSLLHDPRSLCNVLPALTMFHVTHRNAMRSAFCRCRKYRHLWRVFSFNDSTHVLLFINSMVVVFCNLWIIFLEPFPLLQICNSCTVVLQYLIYAFCILCNMISVIDTKYIVYFLCYRGLLVHAQH